MPPPDEPINDSPSRGRMVGIVAIIILGVLVASCVGLTALANAFFPWRAYPESASIGRLVDLKDAVWQYRDQLSPSMSQDELCAIAECEEQQGTVCGTIVDWPEFEPTRIRCLLATDLTCIDPSSGWYCILIILKADEHGDWAGHWRYLGTWPTEDDWVGPDQRPRSWETFR